MQVGTKKLKARARTATGAERARLWQEALKFWPPYADYQQKTEREIPVVVLDPVRLTLAAAAQSRSFGKTCSPSGPSGSVTISSASSGDSVP